MQNVHLFYNCCHFFHAHFIPLHQWPTLHRAQLPLFLRQRELINDIHHLHPPYSLGRPGGDTVVRALTSQQCGQGSNPGINAICGLSQLLVLLCHERFFFRYSNFPLALKTLTLPNSNSIWNARTHFNEFLRISMCSVDKQIKITIITFAPKMKLKPV